LRSHSLIASNSSAGRLKAIDWGAQEVSANTTVTESKATAESTLTNVTDAASKARAVSLNVFGIGEHARLTHIPLVIAPIVFPFAHVVKAGAKLLASNALNDLLASVTCNFD
jgi:hypothetical protein